MYLTVHLEYEDELKIKKFLSIIIFLHDTLYRLYDEISRKEIEYWKFTRICQIFIFNFLKTHSKQLIQKNSYIINHINHFHSNVFINLLGKEKVWIKNVFLLIHIFCNIVLIWINKFLKQILTKLTLNCSILYIYALFNLLFIWILFKNMNVFLAVWSIPDNYQ